MGQPDSRVKTTHEPVGGVVILSAVSSGAAPDKTAVEVNCGADRLESALRSAGLEVRRVQLPIGRKAKIGKHAVEKLLKLAIDSFDSKIGENGNRIAVVAEGKAADQAVLGAGSDQRVRSFCLL